MVEGRETPKVILMSMLVNVVYVWIDRRINLS